MRRLLRSFRRCVGLCSRVRGSISLFDDDDDYESVPTEDGLDLDDDSALVGTAQIREVGFSAGDVVWVPVGDLVRSMEREGRGSRSNLVHRY